jgi:ribulose kinase
MSGGLTKNSLFVSETADVTQCTVILPKEPEAVLLGSAVLGNVSIKIIQSIWI